MAQTPTRDAANALRRALAADGDEVQVSLTRETAELVMRAVDEFERGQQVMVARNDAEVTPNKAAALLGMSRPQVRKLIDQGALDFRKVGTHHRIRVASIQAFLDEERTRRKAALASLAQLQDELGLTE